jgi:hypothetical protein
MRSSSVTVPTKNKHDRSASTKLNEIVKYVYIFAFFERMRAAKIFISTARGSTRLHSQLVVKNICYL